jgi:hypothetical protein
MTVLPNVAELSANVPTTLCGRGYSRRRVVFLGLFADEIRLSGRAQVPSRRPREDVILSRFVSKA